MSYKEFTHWKELEDFETAAKVAWEDWEKNPGLAWPRRNIGWCIVGMLKTHAAAQYKGYFLQRLEEFKRLEFPQNETKLWNAAVYPIRDMLADSLAHQWFDAEFGDRVFDIIRDFPFARPSDAYTALLKAFLPLGSLWPRLAEFIEWWGFEDFDAFDYRRYPDKGVLISLVEKTYLIYLKALCWAPDGRQPSQSFWTGLEKLKATHPDMEINIRKQI